MEAEHWQKVEAIVQSALDIESSAERLRFVAEACAGDAELKGEVERLIAAADDAGSFIESPAWTNGGLLDSIAKKNIRDSLDEQIKRENAEAHAVDDNFTGRKIGVFQLVKELGRGGMGAVFLAERADGEFRQKAAVKLIKRGMDTDFIVKRFRHERQILAALNHPNVATLIDGGTTPDGLPYFVMEYVDGKPLYRFCDELKLGTNERLGLFRHICEAVEAAHRMRVVHRDLKPSNILVKPDGTPKLLDFGIAKILDPDLAAATLEPTATAMRLMTPEYASPEQVCGEPVTPASDIYSLGVLLYELLTGHRPYRLRNRALYEIHRAVCEEMPSAPSESLTNEENLVPTGEKAGAKSATLETIYSARGTDFERLRRELKGDLDKIILKTLRKNPAERYQTALELAADINRFLEKCPVAAETYPPEIEKSQTSSASVSSTGGTKASIAILPFKTLGARTTTGDTAKDTDDSDEFLGIGLADALVTRLSSVPRLVVRPTSSVLGFGETTDPFEAGQKLSVKFVVDGNIRRGGERIRVTVQLLNVQTNATVWAQTFDEELTDVLALEDSISGRVAEFLLPQLTGAEQNQLHKRGTNNAEAYQAYLRGRFFWNQFMPDTFPKALEWFEKAVALDEKYALAYVGIADFYNWATIFGMYSPPEGFRKTKAAAIRALEIDDKLSEAHAILGFLTTFSEFDWTRGEYLLKHALELNPNNALAHEWYSALLAGVGRNEESKREILRAIELDPLSLREKTLTAWHLYNLRLFPEALAVAEEIIEMNPVYYQGFFQRGNILNEMGRCAEAVADLRKALALAPEAGYLYYKLCFALVGIGQRDEARKILRDFEKLPKSATASAYHLAMCYASLDERDRAFEWFDKAVENRDMWLVWLATEPKLDKMRDDERFNELLRKTNRPHLVRQIRKSPEIAQTTAKVFAVLPFKFNSLATGDDTADDKFLGLGLTDALISRLSKAKKLIVRPTSSVLQFNEMTDAFAAGRELAADFVLDGNIRRVGERIRVSVQLLNINQTATAWAEKFDEKYTDVLALEDSIAERVAESLLPQLTGEERKQLQKRETNLPAAYEAYLKGRFYWSLLTEEGFAKAIGFYERAVELDPNYALAYAAIAEYYSFLAIHCVIPFAEAGRRAKAAAERAAAIDPAIAEAQAALGIAAINHDFDWETSERYFRRAIEIAPNSILAHGWYQSLLFQSGRFEEASATLDRLLKLNPDALVSLHYLAWAHFHTRRFDESIAVHRRMLEGEPNYAWGHFTFSWALRCAGERAQAVAEAEKGVELAANNPMYLTALAAAFAENGQREESLKTLDAINEMAATRYVSPYMLAIVYCSLGDREKAFERLETALAERDVWVVWLYVDPQFERLRDDSRFADLLKGMNHPLAPRVEVAESENSIAKSAGETGEKSIAVLPLRLLGSAGSDDTGEDNFLSVGLADALITRLSNVRRFVVRPTSSVLSYGKKTADSFAAGAELGVDFVVDGNFRRVGNRIRVTVQLLSVPENATHWAQTFDEKFSDVLTLEDSISERVAKSLLPHLTGEEERRIKKRGTDNKEAFEAYLRGRHYWNSFTEEGFAKALIFYNKAISIAPDYALAYAGIADYYNFLGVYAVLPFAETAKAAKGAALKAIAIDDDLAEGYAALGFATLMKDFDWSKAGEYIQRAIELNPNYALARIWCSYYLAFCGRFDEALTQISRAMEIDRYTPIVPQTLNWVLYHARRYDEAIEATRQFVKDEPRYGLTFLFFGSMLWHVGQFEEAIKICRRAVELLGRTPYTLIWLASAYAASGQTKQAGELIVEIEELSLHRYVSPYLLAMVYVNLNDAGKTFELLEKAWKIRDGRLAWLGVDLQFDRLRDDARTDDLLRRMNHPLAPRGKIVETKKPIE